MSDENELTVTQPTFHAREGWHWLRLEDGSVRIQRRSEAGLLGDDVLAEVTLEPSSWASVVAFVSARGENAHTYADALAFHEGRQAEAEESAERLAEAMREAELALAEAARLRAELERALEGKP